MKVENNFRIVKNRWIILKNLNMDVKYATLVITTCVVLHNFYHMNNDICYIGISRMQNLHPNLNVNREIPIKITS